MGLDQYWVIETTETIHTHRKFNALQGFMQEEYNNAGHEGDINCNMLTITPEILDRLEAKIDADELEPTAGFFFGNTEKDDWYQEDLKNLKTDIIPDVRQRIKEGENVKYTCWY